MKVSLKWLRSLVSLPVEITCEEIVQKLTMSGLEVENVTEIAKNLTGAIVVEVKGKRKHPQADKLNLVDVFDGKTVTQVVCGASNVPEPGSKTKVVWAQKGATLPSGITLGEKEVRGILSPGMLCSAIELGLATEADGLLLLSEADGFETGADFVTQAGLPDDILEINVTANRPDCLGHIGIARELATLFGKQGAKLTLPQRNVRFESKQSDSSILTRVENNGDCPRYYSVVVENIQVKTTPLPMRLLLERLGLRSVSNVVDATQLAMLEWGQPLHSFDFEKIQGNQLQIRRARQGESLPCLDGVTRELSADDLIAVDAAKPISLVGVIGGSNSHVIAGTNKIFLESAYFQPNLIRKTAKRLKLQTDASYRFERGVDPNLGVEQAMLSCLEWIQTFCPHARVYQPNDLYPQREKERILSFSSEQVNHLLGTSIPQQAQVDLLRSLGMKVEMGHTGTNITVSVPTFRSDIKRPIDIVEEIARLSGYDHIQGVLPTISLAATPEFLVQRQAAYQCAEKARDLCVSLGFFEIQTLPFTSVSRLSSLQFLNENSRLNPLVLQNPLQEEMSALRTHLVPSLLEAAVYNVNQGQKQIRLFEVAEVYVPEESSVKNLAKEQTKVAGILSGPRDGWLKEEKVNFYDLRGLVESLVAALYSMKVGSGEDIEIVPAKADETPWLHPGICAKIGFTQYHQVIGYFGEIHPDVRERLKLEEPLFVFELSLPSSSTPTHVFKPWSKFPQVERDLSFYCDEAIPVGPFIKQLKQAQEPLLQQVLVLDDYREPGKVPTGKKGLLLRLIYQSEDHTLREEEIQKAHEQLIQLLCNQFTVELR